MTVHTQHSSLALPPAIHQWRTTPCINAFRSEALASDVFAVRRILASSGFFSEMEIEVAAEMLEDHLAQGDHSEYRYAFADLDGQPVAFSCYGPIACTIGSFDLYWLAVHNDHRNAGLGRRLMAETERLVAAPPEGGRRLYVETSSRPQYEPTRAFYLRCGYKIDATLPDYYSPGDHKVVFVKPLG